MCCLWSRRALQPKLTSTTADRSDYAVIMGDLLCLLQTDLESVRSCDQRSCIATSGNVSGSRDVTLRGRHGTLSRHMHDACVRAVGSARAQEVVGTSDSALAAVVAADAELMALRAEEAAILARLGDPQLGEPKQGADPQAADPGRAGEGGAEPNGGGLGSRPAADGAGAAAGAPERLGNGAGANGDAVAADGKAAEGAGGGAAAEPAGDAAVAGAAKKVRLRKGGGGAAAAAAAAAEPAAAGAAAAPSQEEDGERLNEIYTRMEVGVAVGGGQQLLGRVETVTLINIVNMLAKMMTAEAGLNAP